jgi:hypothetical protein
MPVFMSAAGLRIRAHPRDPTTTVPQRAKPMNRWGKDIENYASTPQPTEECAGFVKGSAKFLPGH